MYSRIAPLLKNVPSTAGKVARLSGVRHSSSAMHGNDPLVQEEEKSRNLDKSPSVPIDIAPGWDESVASTSEAYVKADHAPGTPAELQRRTVEYIKQDRLNPRFSVEERDQVSGPLSSKGREEKQRQPVVEREEINGPLRRAPGREDSDLVRMDTGRRRKKIVLEEQVIRTTSEEMVKADRGEI